MPALSVPRAGTFHPGPRLRCPDHPATRVWDPSLGGHVAQDRGRTARARDPPRVSVPAASSAWISTARPSMTRGHTRPSRCPDPAPLNSAPATALQRRGPAAGRRRRGGTGRVFLAVPPPGRVSPGAVGGSRRPEPAGAGGKGPWRGGHPSVRGCRGWAGSSTAQRYHPSFSSPGHPAQWAWAARRAQGSSWSL